MCVAISLMMFGCSSNSRYYADDEDALGTSGYYHALDHVAIYYPRGIALNFPGYIVGFEEASRLTVTTGREDVLLDDTAIEAGYTIKRLLKTLRFKVPFVSQVLHYEGRPFGDGNCALYSVYSNKGSSMVDSCNGDARSAPAEPPEHNSNFKRSWYAIDVLKSHLAEDVSSNDYTHLIVAIMGLDTAQEEAIRNYRSIVSSIRLHGQTDFRPLFVGFTWPSYFANRWFDPLWEVLAYGPIADRSDVLGLTWLGVILNDVIAPLSNQIRTTIVSHSFGARATTLGLCVGPAIRRDVHDSVSAQDQGKIDDLIGLAPAFSLLRFDDEEYVFYESIYYEDYCPKIDRFVFTASSNDGAFKPIFWSDMAGNYKHMIRYCEQNQPIEVDCLKATSGGFVDGYDRSAKITYIDASELIRYGMPGTEGKGHSDIYRSEMGRLLWIVINGGTE